MTDLELAYNELKAKHEAYSVLWDYYDGHHPVVYTTKTLRDLFKKIDARFVENWCKVVVDSSADRIEVNRWDVDGNEQLTESLTETWQRVGMHIDSDDVHLACLVTGEAGVIVGRNVDNSIEAYYQDPRSFCVFYDLDHPKVKRVAAKWWVSEGKRVIALYYNDRIETWTSRGKAENVTNGKDFTLTGTVRTEKGVMPVFHFRAQRMRGDIEGVVTLQDAGNKLLNDMMVAGEFGAFKQRWVIGNFDKNTFKGGAGTITNFPASDGMSQPTQVGEFSESDVTRYVTVIENLARSMAIISRTPKQYFFNQGGDPSGEALIAMEAPLVKRTERHIERFTTVWREFGAYVWSLGGVTLDPMAIKPIFDDPATIQPRTQSEMREIDVRTGLPLKTILMREGWSEQEIADMEAHKREEEALADARFEKKQEAQLRAFDRGQEIE